jgi:glycine hydroxymethyltransferase
VKAEHGTEAGDSELATVADEVSALVARAPAYPRS